jgi:hypothetical protein
MRSAEARAGRRRWGASVSRRCRTARLLRGSGGRMRSADARAGRRRWGASVNRRHRTIFRCGHGTCWRTGGRARRRYVGRLVCRFACRLCIGRAVSVRPPLLAGRRRLTVRLCHRWPIAASRLSLLGRCGRHRLCGRYVGRLIGGRGRLSVGRMAGVHCARLVARRRLIVRLRRRRPVGVRRLTLVCRCIRALVRRRRVHRPVRRCVRRLGMRRLSRVHSDWRVSRLCWFTWRRLLDERVSCRNVWRAQALYFVWSERLAGVLCQLLLLLGKRHRGRRRRCLCHHGTVGHRCRWLSHPIGGCGRLPENTVSGRSHRRSRHNGRRGKLFCVYGHGRSRHRL